MALWLDRVLNLALSPALWLAVLLALTYSTLFTMWRGGGWRGWGRDSLAGLIGFGAGQALGMLLKFTWLRVGDVQLFWGTLITLIALILSRKLPLRS